jgi:hypothetical protein
MDGTAAERRGNDGRFLAQGRMARNVPDLPRSEQRRGTRQVMLWVAGVAVVLFAAVLVWSFVTAPNGQLGGTTRPRPTPSTGVLGGYQGDDYLIVGDRLIIVDPSARRVTAIVPNIGLLLRRTGHRRGSAWPITR